MIVHDYLNNIISKNKCALTQEDSIKSPYNSCNNAPMNKQ